MSGPEPLVIPWRGRQLRVRHVDPRLSKLQREQGLPSQAFELLVRDEAVAMERDEVAQAPGR
jgi:hypothetical protein